jgi:NAD(P)-dependent dehydrogenase (short-subunit alcohol dehydrogenase family)
LGINHLGHFALTGLLLDHLAQSPAGARVVTVSSVTHRRGAMDFDDLMWERGYRRAGAYARSKLANLLFAYELDRRLRAAGAKTISLAAHPGYARTSLSHDVPPVRRAAIRLGGRMMGQSAELGALALLRAATDPNAAGGEYYGPGSLTQMKGYPTRVSSSASSRDEALAARLWQESEKLTGVSYL